MSSDHMEYGAAASRLNRALERLESSLQNLGGRIRTHARIEADTQKLLAERARFASELEKMTAKARRLDDGASEVARRLVVAMDTVNDVLRDA
jgi:uncharacterized membrane-anchored protein